jgi:acetyl esterase/lipase
MAQAGDKAGALDLYGSLMKLFAGGDQAQGTGIGDSIKAGANEASINSLINAEGGEDSAGKAAEGKVSAGDAANEDPLKTIKGDGTLTNKAQASADGMILGEDGQKDAQLVKMFSTQNAVRRHLTPPAIIIMANDDRLVPPVTNGVAYYSAMRNAGNECSMYIYPSGDHGFGFGPWFKYR